MLPLPVALQPEEPTLSLLRRTASLHGLRLRHLCRVLGPLTGDPDTWQAAHLCRASAGQLADLLDTDIDTLQTAIPDLIDESGAGVRRRRLPHHAFGRPNACPPCLGRRNGAAHRDWDRPWHVACIAHAHVQVDGPLEGVAERIVDSQLLLDALVCDHGWSDVEDALADARHLVEHWCRWEGLDILLLRRAVATRPEWGERLVIPALPDLLLLPEVVEVVEALLTRQSAKADRVRRAAFHVLGHVPSPRGWRPAAALVKAGSPFVK